jgi:hypothetical protein
MIFWHTKSVVISKFLIPDAPNEPLQWTAGWRLGLQIESS